MHNSTPVLLIIFNRPDLTRKVFESICISKPSRLYIAADAPRSSNMDDLEKCSLARAATENIDWPCEVRRLYQELNLGCSLGPRAAFDWFFSHESEGIILEDDCVPHPDFFSFASTMLDRYRNDKKIISINGSNLGYKLNTGYSYTFSRFMNMWGWATWKRSYDQIDFELHHWRKVHNKELFLWKLLRNHWFDFDMAWVYYWKFQFDKTISTEKLTWWDYQWIYYQLTHKQLAIVPARNLVTNIGFNSDGHHTLFSDSPAANIPTYSLNLNNYKHPFFLKVDFLYEREFVKKIWCIYQRFSLMQTVRYILSAFLKHVFKENKT